MFDWIREKVLGQTVTEVPDDTLDNGDVVYYVK